MKRQSSVEAAVLMTLLLQNKKLAAAKNAGLLPEHFSSKKSRGVFKAILKVAKTGESVDLITVMDVLKKSKQFRSVGGTPYLLSLFKNLESTRDFSKHVRHLMKSTEVS
jgi:replicative DNA helicase